MLANFNLLIISLTIILVKTDFTIAELTISTEIFLFETSNANVAMYINLPLFVF